MARIETQTRHAENGTLDSPSRKEKTDKKETTKKRPAFGRIQLWGLDGGSWEGRVSESCLCIWHDRRNTHLINQNHFFFRLGVDEKKGPFIFTTIKRRSKGF